ncbi:cytochrome-c domain-containing protein [Rhizobium phaseoli]|uniref:di-heme oxidoredictase family protein n=1 Tax=Rhizobium phaseoli TaxID=396 RepID=UPI0007E98CCA|nr:di-heme oxidoredictase family protein [Rhizobium phaseoli]ANL70412.1 cytochrome-c domain-containing protein [Rhizobium phaseoli]
MKALTKIATVLAVLSPSFTFAEYRERAITVFPDQSSIEAGTYPISKVIEDGKALFRARFTPFDGAGRPFATGDSKPTPRLKPGPSFQRIAGPDASSCEGCHNQPLLGGSGDFAANVFVGAQFSDPPVDMIKSKVTNERNTTTLFGAGALEILASEMTEELHAKRDAGVEQAMRNNQPVKVTLETKGVSFGYLVAYPDGHLDEEMVDGVDYDLVIRPFGAKGITASIREFTVAALNHHHGIQAVERFGWERTGVKDFDADGYQVEFTIGQVTALSFFQASLQVPNYTDTRRPPAIFEAVGCGGCHVSKFLLHSGQFQEPNRYNRPGTLRGRDSGRSVSMDIKLPVDGSGNLYIAPFSDLRRHRMCDETVNFLCNEELRQDNVEQSLFITAKLWNLATSAPYCHRGDCPTILQAIKWHGGDARASRDMFLALGELDQKELIEYLKTLGGEQE